MFVPATFAIALVMTILSTICWGSFANTYKLTKNYRFEFYYWDYALGIVLISLVLAFTMGSTQATGESFLANVRWADGSNILCAAVGGFIFNIANLLLIAGIEMAGMAVAFPISIGIALVVGVVMSYAIQPKGNPTLLGVGVALAIVAVIMVGKAYGNLPTGGRTVSRKSVVVCLISGLLMGSFAPFVTRALTAGKTLTPYSIAVFFTLGALVCCLPVLTFFMRKPLVGTPVNFSGYLAARGSEHFLGLAGGIVWGLGTVFNFVAASFVGVAIAYAIGQASPMVAALWGVFVWHEFRGASAKAKFYVAGMFVSYLLALVAIAQAYRLR
ncbi:MAG: GRP family sugar transporter [Acidobacteriia bacterium]|nr:GRP family sugar transporter [Terriglobia bacterium]